MQRRPCVIFFFTHTHLHSLLSALSQPTHYSVYTVSLPYLLCLPTTRATHLTTHIYVYVPLSRDPYAENGYAARAGSNTTRDSISRVAPSTGPALRVRLAARAASVPALTRGRPAVPRRPGTGRSRHTARRAALAPDELAPGRVACAARRRPAARRCTRHSADAVACKLAADDEAQPPAQRGDDVGALLLRSGR